MNLVVALRRLVAGDESELGRRWQRILNETSGAGVPRRQQFERMFRARRGDGRVRLGRRLALDDRHAWFGIPWQDAAGLRAWITGASGGGKTYEALAILLQLLRRPFVLWVFDFKGELADLLMNTVLPALACRPEGRWLLGRVHVIDPFGEETPALRITEPEPGVPRHVQAMTLSATMQEVLNADHGLRMERAFLFGGALSIELRQPLTALARWFREPELFGQMAARSSDPLIRDYAANVFPKEPRPSLQALGSRLDLLFFLPEIRRAFEAPSCVSFNDLCQEGVFIFRVGGAPAGSEAVEAAIGSLLIGRATRAIMGRVVEADTLPLLMLFDEGQRAIRSRDMDHLERVLTQARFKRSSFVFCNQDMEAQLPRDFAHLLRTNTSTEFIFRANPEDASRVARHLPMTVPGVPESDQRQAIADVITHLPNREFILWSKALGQAERMRSPRIDLASLEREAAAIPRELRDQLRAPIAASTHEPLVEHGSMVHGSPFGAPAEPDDLIALLG